VVSFTDGFGELLGDWIAGVDIHAGTVLVEAVKCEDCLRVCLVGEFVSYLSTSLDVTELRTSKLKFIQGL
jgi:hypothetical protein